MVLPSKQRLSEIDLIRGIALLGIFLMNIQFMSTDSLLVENWSNNFSNPFDYISDKLRFLFLAQRFIGIFSLLFGLGIAIQQQNFKNSGVSFNGYYFKRALILSLIGMVQILFFYMGDILLIYSLLSIFLFLFFKLSNKMIFLSAILVFFVPALIESSETYNALINNFTENIKNHYTESTIVNAYQTGTLLQMMKARLTEYFFYDLTGIMWSRTSFACMLIGYLIGRNNLYANYAKYWGKLKVTLIFCFLAYGAFIVYFLIANVQFGFYINMVYNLHIILSIATYILGVLLIYKHNIFKKLTSLIINVGKISLSNYLLQAIICAFIFTNYGFSLFAKTSPTQNVLIVIGIYMFQIVLSNMYLSGFKIGPLEFFWRKLAR